MSEVLLTDFDYAGPRKTFNYYNSERREVRGGLLISQAEGIDNHYEVNQVNTFANYDFSGCFSEDVALHIPIMSWSNGLSFVWDAWVYSETAEYITLIGYISVFDKNGHDVSEQFYSIYNTPGYTAKESLTVAVGRETNAVSNLTFRVLGSLANYYRDTTPPMRLSIIWANADNDTDMDDAPALSGEISENKYNRYYTLNTAFDLSNQDKMDRFFNALTLNGDGTPITPILPSEDISEPGGGDIADPDYNPFSDPVDFPGLPTGGSAIASGFIRVYNPTAGQLQQLAGKLWSNDFYNTIEKIMNDPMEAMISLHAVPFSVVGGGPAHIEIGNYDSEISANTITAQYYTVDCGNISLPEHWASALDYSPYTTVDIFIPFVGVRSLQIDDVMNKVLNLKYNIDILTGSAVAMLKSGNSVLYTYNTQVHSEIPYTMGSYGRLVQSIISTAGGAIAGSVTGGAGTLLGASIGGAIGTALTKHSDVSRGGSLGGPVGVMGDFVPYLIIHRPIQSLAGDFAHKKGYPANISASLGSVSGYTVVDKVHLTGIDCTDSEREEIHALLKDGVII